MKRRLTHLDESGGIRMVDVGEKAVTKRTARARATVSMKPSTLKAVVEDRIAKGNVFATAKVAGILAAKKVGELVPLCHPLAVESVDVSFRPLVKKGELVIHAEVSVHAKTGAEMEALQAAAQAALTVYDMCKSVDRGMAIGELVLLEKAGGRSGRWARE